MIFLRQNIIDWVFYYRLHKFEKFTPQTVKTKKKKKIVYSNALNLYDKPLGHLF